MIERARARLRSLSAAQWQIAAQSAVMLPAMRLSLRLRGFDGSARAAAAWSRRGRRDRSDQVPQVVEAVELVAHRPVIGAPCLARSLVLWAILRRGGTEARLVLGARSIGRATGSFAHAWVEVDGVPVNDAADVRDRYPAFDLTLDPLPRGAPPRR